MADEYQTQMVDGVEFTLVPTKEFNNLLESQQFLDALQAAGVDNWDGYDIAREFME